MAVKRDWVQKLEDDKTNKLIQRKQLDEVDACHRRILAEGCPKLWERIKSQIKDALSAAKLGLIFNVKSQGNDFLRITISSTRPFEQGEILDVQYLPSEHRIEIRNPGADKVRVVLFFGVLDGRTVLYDNQGHTLPDDEENDIAVVASQRLLEPILRSYLQI